MAYLTNYFRKNENDGKANLYVYYKYICLIMCEVDSCIILF